MSPHPKSNGMVKLVLAGAALLAILTSLGFSGDAESKRSPERGNIQGVVVDNTGAPVPGAKVWLVNAQQTRLGPTETDAHGYFHLAGVPPGSWAVLASHRDFSLQKVSAQVFPGETIEVRLALEISPLSYQITVTAELGQVQDKDRVPQEVNIIADEAIRQRSTAVLAQVADEEVGVALQRTSPTLGGIFVRGLAGKNVPIYVDGVRYTTSTGRGGINTFLDLNEPSSLRSVEILRGPNSAQYGSDSLGGTVQLISRVPDFGGDLAQLHGEVNTFYTSADASWGANTLLSYGTRRFGLLTNFAGRRVNTLRPADGLDGHAAVTRFLGLPSNILGSRMPDTAFTQYAGTLHLSYSPGPGQQISGHYQRSQQDGGKRYDQLLGGDGNLIADLRNLMLDFLYGRYDKQGAGFFDNASFTASYNTQREERVNQGGQGNPRASITSQYERTKALGFNFHLDKSPIPRNTFLIGADLYRETVVSPAYTFLPASGVVTPSRPRIPNGAQYLSYGFYAQDLHDLIPGRLRLSAALRYNVASYRSRASNSPLVNGLPLFPDDSLRVGDFSGRAGLVVTPHQGFDVAFNYSRGFRAPNITDLGTLGLTGDGFEVSSVDIAGLNGTIGTTADDKAASSGIPVSPMRSEISNNFDLSLRVHNHRLETDLTGFLIDLNNTITKQSLILPPGAVGLMLGDQPIVQQLPNGVVFVSLSPNPVLVRSNLSDSRLWGVEYTLRVNLTGALSFGGHFTYIRAKDKATGLPPNIEGGTPAPAGFVRLRYSPPGKRYWIELSSTLANDQNRLSSLDLSDRRTGASRSRTNVASFFNNGARVRGLISNGPDGRPGTADDVLTATGETLAQVQQRILGSTSSAPLFRSVPGYGLVNLRAGFRLGERSDVAFAFENIADKGYRGISWGMDGPGRSVTVRYRYRF